MRLGVKHNIIGRNRLFVSNYSSPPIQISELYHATCFPGLEKYLVKELEEIKGIHSINVTKAVEGAYEINLKSRVALRILNQIVSGPLIVDNNLRGGDSIYEFTKSNVNWMNYYPKSKGIEKEGGLISVNARLYECDDINSSYLIEKRVRDAICDQIRDKTGFRPRPPHNSNNHDINNVEFIDLPIFVIAHKNIVTLFRDMSGDSLHHRYYKASVIHKASLNETWAAGILYEADWNQKVSQYGSNLTLIDPMCGSGTLLLEASLMACNIPPGILRKKWPFQTWPDYNESSWNNILKKASINIVNFNGFIIGNDISEKSMRLAQDNKKGLNSYLNRYCPNIEFRVGDCVDWNILNFTKQLNKTNSKNREYGKKEKEEKGEKDKHTLVISNPPWGIRLADNSEETWKNLGFFLKNNIGGGEAYILSGNKKSETTRYLGLKSNVRIPLKISGINTVLVHYSILPKKNQLLSGSNDDEEIVA